MTREDPGAIHFHGFWAERARDPALPLWMRLAAFAYSHHRKNGHATCLLDGESTLPVQLEKANKRQIQNAINQAVKRGFLAEGSNLFCLVLPEGITGGAEGNAYAKCKLHPSQN